MLGDQRVLLLGQLAGLEQDRVGHRDLADVVQQEAELDLRRLLDREPDGAGQLHPVRGDALGVLAGVRVARLDGVRQRAHGRAVGAAQLLRARALLLEDLAQIGGVALELALACGGLLLGSPQACTQGRDGVLVYGAQVVTFGAFQRAD